MALKENKNGHRFDKIYYFLILILLSSILLSNVAAAEVLHVSSSRYSIFAPYENKASHASLSANFTGYAILLNNTGRPVSGQSITFRIYSATGLKATFTNITQQNGLASVSYDTYNDFTTSSDTDYGTWRIEANLTSNPSVNDRTNMRIEAGGRAVGGCDENYCHKTNTVTGAKPLSPYTANYGSTSTRAAAAHKKSIHQNAGCPACHPGYASDKTATGTDGKVYGKTGDVHSNRTCEYCHGNWAYIRGTGNGIPRMPNCYQCHPVLNNNVMNISTLANLAAGNGISVFSYNYDLKKPLAAHNGTMYSLTDSVPCLICHGPAHNNSKPYNAVSSSNSVTENEQCWTCHTNRATIHKSNTDCVSCHSQDIHKIISASGGPDCVSCHDLTGTAPKKVDVTVLQSSSHNNLNGASTGINKACYACHSDGTAPTSGHPLNYKNPKLCADCHTGPGNYSAPLVAEHNQNGQDIVTNATCNTCHDNGGMFLPNSGTNGMTTAFMHYLKDVTNTATTPYGHSGPIDTSNCIECHNGAYTENASWGSPVNIATSTKRAHTETQTSQCDICHKDGNVSSLASVDFHNASVQTASDSCISCHSQPPSGTARYNMTGAHDLHKAKGYGTLENTSCQFCHNNAGGYELGHPQNDGAADVAVNASATMTYFQNLASGNDDTCSGVSCHSNGLSNGAKVGNATWNTATAGVCNECHSTVPSGLPPTGNHTRHYTTKGYSCAECHGTNADAGTQLGHKSNALIDINFTNVTGSINASKTCSVYCHSPNPNDPKSGPTWGTSTVVCGDCHSIPPTSFTTRNNMAHTAATNCNDCHGAGAENGTQVGHINGVITTEGMTCASCHASYGTAVSLSQHNQTLNTGAPACTDCHNNTGYGDLSHTSGNKVYTVNESNTCRNCHIDNVNGFKEAHTGSSDCTQCHFANTTQTFSLNSSLYAHDHNLVVEHSYYEYNTSGGMPLAINGGTGVGMFPQYTCSLTCHAVRTPEKVDKASSTWLNSSHANSRFGASDSKNNCAKCKSPLNYDDTLTATNPVIAEEDWAGIQCRVCHNLHNRSFSGISGNPAAFYNATASSYVNYSVYDKISSNTELCEKCHQPGSSHDSKFAGTHKSTLNFTCTSCHMNSSFNRGMHDFQVRNMNTSTTGCETCHNPATHSFQFTSQHTEKVDCVACHDQTFTTVNATGYAVSSDNYFGLWKETPTSKWTTAKKMSTSPGTWPLHNLSKSVNCDKCHNGAQSVFNGTIVPDSGAFCEGCHSQPPSGTTRYNMTGAHDLHSTEGYGNVPETSCDYCHSTGGNNEAGHPNTDDNATVFTNSSANITTYVMNPVTGNDDTCAGVSCHSGGLSNGSKVGTATWDTTTAGACNECHSEATSGLPPTGNHTKHYSNESYSCAECHGTNADAGTQLGHKTNAAIDINFTNVTGSIALSTCTVYCHSPNPNDPKSGPTWGTSTVVCGDCHSIPPTSFTTRNNMPHTSATNCNDCHGAGAENGTQAGHLNGVITTEGMTCVSCHASYGSAVLSSKHNQSLNPDAPTCTDCHNNTGYGDLSHTSGNKVYKVNESNTCRNCHIDNVNGFKEAHTGSSDCTQCHFANTTQPFSLNESLYAHDHNLVVEHSYYEYNTSGGMPLAINGGTGVGMFPQYTCSLTCHAVRTPEKVDKASSTWLNSSHANSRFGASDSKNNCAKCKSPLNYDDTLTATNPVIAEEDWAGIQCRVCHNLHNRSFSGISGNPAAFYNATASSYVNYSVYDKISSNTELCEKCHQPGSSHDSKFAGTHKDTLNFTCTSCHMNASFNRGMHDFQVRNMNTSTTGCETCHNPANHSFQFTFQHTEKVDCVACHDQTFTTVNATGYAVSSDNYFGLWKETPTSKWTTAKKISTSPGTWPLHNLSRSVDCDKCHGALSVYNGTIAPSLGNGTGCILCHNPSGSASTKVDTANFGVHNNVNNTDGGLNDSDCSTCHFDTSGMGSGYVAQPGINVYTCSECHTTPVKFGAPFVAEHNENGTDVITSANCTLCHSNAGMYLDNSGTNGTGTAITHYIKDVTDKSSLPYQHNGPINTSNCIDCHNGAYTENASWGTPVNISTSTKRIHTETQTSQCDLCHKDSNVSSLALVDFHNSSVRTASSTDCLGCHATVSPADLGLHSTLNGTSAVEKGDCTTCHFASFPMVKGAVNNNNTYFCEDCHTTAGTGPNKSTRIFTDKKHGVAACIECHVADGTYHQGNPRGSVANSTYISRYPTTNTITTDCADCHRAANLDDAPFYAPGGGSHIGESCTGGGCHGPSGSVVQVVHNVNPLDSLSKKPNISTPALDYSTVPQGTEVNVTVTVNFTASYGNALVDGAQYRIMSDLTEISPWTPMIASDGNFDSIRENASGRINTNNLSGTYNIEVSGMGGGPSQNPLERYYPMNGDISPVKTAILTVQPQGGFINGRITSDGNDLEGVLVTTSGASDITGLDGTYTLSVPPGTYNVTASKLPEYNDNTTFNIEVNAEMISYANMSLSLKSVGTISGTVTNG